MNVQIHPPKGVAYVGIQIRKKRGDQEYLATDNVLPLGTVVWPDDFWKDGDLYSQEFLNKDEMIAFQSEFLPVTVADGAEIALADLYHPEELKVSCIRNGHLVSVIHQVSNSTWWSTTRSWLVKVENGKINLSDDLFFPKQQPAFNYSDLELGGIYIMPAQMFEFLSYLSIIIEKPYYAFPNTIPKMFAISELVSFLSTAVGYFNSQPPATRFMFHYSTTLSHGRMDHNPHVGVPEVQKELITRLAMIEAYRTLVHYWAEQEFTYNDAGVDIEVGKYDKFSSMLEALNSDLFDQLDRIKRQYMGRGKFLGAKKNVFGTGFSGNVSEISNPVLMSIRDEPGVRQGILLRVLSPNSHKI